MGDFVQHVNCKQLLSSLADGSVDLLLTDPPYYGVVGDAWDNQWKSAGDFVAWFLEWLELAKRKLRPNGTVIFFGGIGKPGERPFFDIVKEIESSAMLHTQELVTWKKRRAYGKSKNLLFTREEIYVGTVHPKNFTFNVPLSETERGYSGYNAKYPAKSSKKRVTNVWAGFDGVPDTRWLQCPEIIEDIPELQRPERVCQKPFELGARLIRTYSNPGDLVVDPFSGWGTFGVNAVLLDREFLGSERRDGDAIAADERVNRAFSERLAARTKTQQGEEALG